LFLPKGALITDCKVALCYIPLSVVGSFRRLVDEIIPKEGIR